MAEILLVDGYNIISNWPELAAVKKVSLDAARGKLCQIMQRYLEYRWDQIYVIFDAYQVQRLKQDFPRDDSFTVVFSSEGETADMVIERLAGELAADGHQVEVATSDALVQQMVLGRGARRISARELREQLCGQDTHMKERYFGLLPEQSRHILGTRINDDIRKTLEKWRRRR
jgi:hypothetical protein